MQPKVVKACCNECEKDVLNGDKALICVICEKWYHTKCQRVPNGDYEFLNKSDDSIQWHCNLRKGAPQKLFKTITCMYKRQEEIDSKIEDLSTNITTCNEEIGSSS